jgi:plasmid stabilization system protein ParE
MTNRLRFHPLVSSDLRGAIRWYDEISKQLADRFRKRVNARFDDIETQPQLFPTAFDDVRFARVRRFPYLILFRETEHAVLVLGVFHAASNPEKWRQRRRQS